MKIAIDFDGVICNRIGIPSLKEEMLEMEPIDGALDAIILLQKLGHEVWIFTSNPETEKIKEWLNEYEFPPLEVTNVKRFANAYIDDRAIRFTNWQDVRKYFA